jgi:hypothetical protein
MIVTKHIFPDRDRIEKMGACVERHQGNFSAALREMMNHAPETLNGAVNYAFGNKVGLKVTKSLTYGDNFSEVMIRIP